MSELKWNWVYYPYLDAPNKQEESALKAGYIKVVLKSEADKVIADKDKEIRHHKYKRCLAMAKLCVNGECKLKRVEMRDMNDHQFWQFDNDYWLKWNERWLELAQKCKEAK